MDLVVSVFFDYDSDSVEEWQQDDVEEVLRQDEEHQPETDEHMTQDAI
mgnify:CR=1 FL=1